MRRLAFVFLAASVIGCQQSTEVPLIEFPKGAPAPPPASKDSAPPQGANTSKADPTTAPR